MTEAINSIKKGDANKILRWVVLILVSIVIAANYYVFDAMSSIKAVIQENLGFTNTEYGIIVSFYSFPNTFFLMAVLGGIILDKWGIRKTGFMFVTFCVLGALLTAYGASKSYQESEFLYNFMGSFLKDYTPELKMMSLGRLLFGLGAEASIVVVNKVMVKWFRGKELATAFAVNIAIARIGTAAALILSPVLIGSEFGWSNALWIAAILMAIGLLFFIIYMFFDKKQDKFVSDNDFKEPEEEFEWKDILGLFKNRSYIYVILLCVTFYSGVFPFLAYAPDLLYNKFGLNLADSAFMKWFVGLWEGVFGGLNKTQESLIISGFVTSLIPIGTVFFTPLFGAYVDKKGKRASLMVLGSFLLIIVHLTLSLTRITPYLPMFILGIAFSLIPAAMWPAVALIIKEKSLGTAYGMMASLQNLGLWAFPILAGRILDITNPNVTEALIKSGEASYDYTYTVLMFAALGIVGLLFSFLLMKEDKSTRSFDLEAPSK